MVLSALTLSHAVSGRTNELDMTRYSTGIRTRWKPALGITALLLTLFLFLSPVVTWAAAAATAWWWPFAAWGVVIALIALARESPVESVNESPTQRRPEPPQP